MENDKEIKVENDKETDVENDKETDVDIAVVSIDVDGTLTDGLYQIDRDGNVVKSFYTRDFCGIQILLEDGIKVVIITQSHDTIIEKQVNRIASHSYIWKEATQGKYIYDDNQLVIKTGCDNKKEVLQEYLERHDLTFENLAHIGDAENDLELLEVAGYTACPADAIEDITDVDYRCENKGGRGAVYEFCRHLSVKEEGE